MSKSLRWPLDQGSFPVSAHFLLLAAPDDLLTRGHFQCHPISLLLVACHSLTAFIHIQSDSRVYATEKNGFIMTWLLWYLTCIWCVCVHSQTALRPVGSVLLGMFTMTRLSSERRSSHLYLEVWGPWLWPCSCRCPSPHISPHHNTPQHPTPQHPTAPHNRTDNHYTPQHPTPQQITPCYSTGTTSPSTIPDQGRAD